jgi:hypothetical protein
MHQSTPLHYITAIGDGFCRGSLGGAAVEIFGSSTVTGGELKQLPDEVTLPSQLAQTHADAAAITCPLSRHFEDDVPNCALSRGHDR